MRKMAPVNGFRALDDEVTQTQIVVGEGGRWRQVDPARQPRPLAIEATVRSGRPAPSGGRPARPPRSAF